MREGLVFSCLLHGATCRSALKVAPEFPGDEKCWTPGFDFNACCHDYFGETGNEDCWFSGDSSGDFTFERCCFTPKTHDEHYDEHFSGIAPPPPKPPAERFNMSNAKPAHEMDHGFDIPIPSIDMDVKCVAEQTEICRSMNAYEGPAANIQRTMRNIMQAYNSAVEFEVYDDAGVLRVKSQPEHSLKFQYILRYARIADRIQAISCYNRCFPDRKVLRSALSEACNLLQYTIGPFAETLRGELVEACVHGIAIGIPETIFDEFAQHVREVFDHIDAAPLLEHHAQGYGLSGIGGDLSLGKFCESADWKSTHLGAFNGESKGAHPFMGWVDFRISPFTALMKMKEKGVALSGHLVNLGTESGNCGEGFPNHDFANCMLDDGYGGIFVEPFVSKFNQTRFDVLPQKDEIIIEHEFVFPDNVSDLIFSSIDQLPASSADFASVPPSRWSIDFLKVDIDSVDYAVTESLLTRGFTPKLIQIEWQSFLPPPFEIHCPFERELYGEKTFKQTVAQHLNEDLASALYQLEKDGSLMSFARLLKGFGYENVHVDPSNALFVRSDLTELIPHFSSAPLEDKFATVFCEIANHPRHPTLQYLGIDIQYMFDKRIPAEERAWRMSQHFDKVFKFHLNQEWPCEISVAK